jgi:gluconate 5-dehydrogenase
MTQTHTLSELLDLRGRCALVTGGAGYLGTAMSEALAESGARVFVTYLPTESEDESRARDLVRRLPVVAGAEHCAVALDHMSSASIEQCVAETLKAAGHIDVLVSSGHERLAADLTTVTAEEFDRQLRNATGYFLLARFVRDDVVGRGAGASIILIGSMYGMVSSDPTVYAGIGSANPVAYQTMKAGVIQMTRHLAVHWAGDGVRVNCISPGPFPPPDVDARLAQRLGKKCPMGRLGSPHELKGAVVFLASDASSYVTGHNLVVDGGWTAW